MWIVLQIGIERDQVFAARRLQSGPTRGRFAAIEREALRANPRITRGQFRQHFPRPVFAAIVRDDDFVWPLERLDRDADGFNQLAQISLFVVAGNDEADLGRCRNHGL